MNLDFDLTNPEHVRDPYPVFKALREQDPVFWSDNLRGWLVTRYDDVKTVLHDQVFSADRIRPFMSATQHPEKSTIQKLGQLLTLWAVFNDPPDHTRLRNLLNKSFTPVQMKPMRPRVEAIVEHLLDDVTQQGQIDFIADFAFPLPATVIATMLGVPAQDIGLIKEWSDKIAKFVFNSVEDGRYTEAKDGLFAMADYFRGLFALRRADPQDDIISLLLTAQEEGGMVSEDEVASNCILLVFAGHETTTNLIANGIYNLSRHPEQMETLRAHPERVRGAVEEMLRYEGPSAAMVRIATRDLQLGDKTIEKGQRVFPVINSANRDSDRFERPDEFDISREDNQHLAFGYGIHFCLGAPLARLEAHIAVNSVLARMPDLKILEDNPRWIPQLLARGMESLPVSFAPGVGAVVSRRGS